MNGPIRILHLDCTMGKGGQERDHLSEALEFTKRGHSYTIAARPGTFLLDAAEKSGVGIPVPFRSNFDIKSFLILRRFLQTNGTDILVTTSYIDSILGWFTALSLGRSRPVVVRQRHLLNPPKSVFPYRHFCDYLVAVSDIARFGYIERKIPFWKVISLPRGISEPDQDVRGGEGALPGIPEDGRMILQIGTFQRDKGQLSLLEGMLPHLRSHPSLHLVLLGDGPLKDNILRRLSGDRFREVAHRIHLPGWSDPGSYYKKASVTVISSFREAFSLVALESLYHGVPVVGFRQGGMPEVSSWAQWGELIDPWDVPLLCRRSADWALRPDRSCPAQDKIRKTFRERFSIEAAVDRTERFYRWALARKRMEQTGVNPYALVGGRGDPFFFKEKE